MRFAQKYPLFYQHGIIVAFLVTLLLLFGSLLVQAHRHRPHWKQPTTPWAATTHAWFAFIDSPCSAQLESARQVLANYPRALRPLGHYTMRNIEVAKNCALTSAATSAGSISATSTSATKSPLGHIANSALAKVVHNYHANLVTYALAVRMEDIHRKTTMQHHIWNDMVHLETFPTHMFQLDPALWDTPILSITPQNKEYVVETPSKMQGTLVFGANALTITQHTPYQQITVPYRITPQDNSGLMPFTHQDPFMIRADQLVSWENEFLKPLDISSTQIALLFASKDT